MMLNQVPAWLLAALAQEEPSWSPPDAGGKGKGGKGKDKAPIELGPRRQPIPPWLSGANAAQGAPKAKAVAFSKGVGKTIPAAVSMGRTRVKTTRVQGTIVEWNAKGGTGRIKPATSIDHPDAQKPINKLGLHLARNDLLPKGTDLPKGTNVTFFVYSDGMKLGAESCMKFNGTLISEAEESAKAPESTGKAKGKFKMGAPSPLTQLLLHKGAQKGGFMVNNKFDGKGKGKSKDGKGFSKSGKGGGKKGFEKGGPKLPRTRFSEGVSVTGKVVEWKGYYGWVEPDAPIEHPKAAKHKGHLYVHQRDVLDGSALSKGQTVNFHIYEDESGLGIEECIAC